MQALGAEITHVYGLTETYGPLAVCAWNPGWDERSAGEQARLRARQGVATVVSERLRVVGLAHSKKRPPSRASRWRSGLAR